MFCRSNSKCQILQEAFSILRFMHSWWKYQQERITMKQEHDAVQKTLRQLLPKNLPDFA
jgi:hypothetical protein